MPDFLTVEGQKQQYAMLNQGADNTADAIAKQSFIQWDDHLAKLVKQKNLAGARRIYGLPLSRVLTKKEEQSCAHWLWSPTS